MRFGCLGTIMAVALLIAAIGLLAYRPSPLLGLDGDSLASSLQKRIALPGAVERCRRPTNGRWACSVSAVSGGAGARYRVRTHGLGCWDATRVRSAGSAGGVPRRVSGCITILDHIPFFQRL